MERRTVIILGAGVGGLVAAHRLRRALPRDHRVLLIEREREHLFQPSLLWLAVGSRRLEQIRRPLDGLRRKGIELLGASVEAIDPARRAVVAGGQEHVGDALIVALGAELAPELIPGLAEGGHNLYTAEGAAAIHDALRGFRGGRVVVVTAAPAYKCPAAPYEAAMLVEDWLRRNGVRAAAGLDFYAAEPGPMGVAGVEVSAAVRGMVEGRGVRYHPDQQVTRVEPVSRTLSFANGASAGYDLLIYIPPHRVPGVVQRSGLAPAGGWVAVDRGTFETVHRGVFAIGDVTTVPLAMGKPLPKAGVFAHRQAEVVADNLASQWAGRRADQKFDGHGACFLEAGAGLAGYGAGDFYAEPTPRIALRGPSRMWHWGKVLFERHWLRKWF